DRREQERAQQLPSREAGPDQRERAGDADAERRPRRGQRDPETAEEGPAERRLPQQVAVPAKGEPRRREDAVRHAGEGVEGDDGERQQDEPDAEGEDAPEEDRTSPVGLRGHRWSSGPGRRRSAVSSTQTASTDRASSVRLATAPCGQLISTVLLYTVSGSTWTRPPPSSWGVTNALSASVKQMRAPATTPGIVSGSVTRRKVAPQPAPRSRAASLSVGSRRPSTE